MLSVVYNPNMCSFQPYNPYEQLLLEQEPQRRRQIEALRLRRQLQLEQLERRRQYEYARQMAELRRRREMEMESINECRHDRRVENLFDALRTHRMSESAFAHRRSTSPQERAMPLDAERREGDEVSQNAVSNDAVSTPVPALTTSTPTSESSKSYSESQTEPMVEIANEPLPTPDPSEASASHATISHILSTLATLKSDFTFPTQLDFASSATSLSPRLAYTSANAPVHQYEHQLTGLLTQLDAVESYGDEDVRKARKEAVKAVERELEEVDGRKAEAWTRATGSEEVVAEVEDPILTEVTTEVELSQPEELAVLVDLAHQEATGSGSNVDPSHVPLPQDEEMNKPAPDSSVASTISSSNPTQATPHSPAMSLRVLPPTAETLVDAAPSPLDPVPSTSQQSTSSASTVEPSTDADKPTQTSLSESTGSETSESELDEFVEINTDMEVDTMSTTSAEEVEQDRDLAEMDDWEVDF